MRGSKQVDIRQAKTQLSRLIAEVERGQEIVVARDGTPVAKLVPFPAARPRRLRVGDWTGKVWISPDFDAPLGEAELKDWGF